MNFEIECSTTTVQFWSDVRLPFEPKGEAKLARGELRRALATLGGTGELSAEYSSSDCAFCDVENVLLYNVGPAHFSKLGANRIQIQRTFGEPVRPPSGRVLTHHHRYAAVSAAPVWLRRRVIAERTFPVPSGLRASTVWAAARQLAAPSALTSTVQQLALDVEVFVPQESNFSLPSSMKMLLDGIVASFHRHDRSGELSTISSRIAAHLGGTESGVVERLLLEGPAELGVRALVREFGKGVQWNPADDWLVALDLRVKRTGATQAHCSASLSEVVHA